MATIKLLLAAGLAACAVGHVTHVCTMTTPGSSDTCGSFVLWLGTYHTPPSAGNIVPGKAVVQLGQTIYPDSPFTFTIGDVALGTDDPFCAYSAMPGAASFGVVRDHLTSSAFRSACPAGVQHHISDQTVVKCFDSSTVQSDGTPNVITDPNSRGGCDVGGSYDGQIPNSWYYIELEADSSADLLVSLDGVDQNLSPQRGACSLSTTSALGPDTLFGGRIRIPAEVLDIPSCGGGCLAAFPVPPDASSVSNCDANTPSGRICTITCQVGFQLVGGNTRCDNGAYVGTSLCTDRTTCSLADAVSTISGLIGVTGSGCGTDTAEGSVCFFNCGVGFFSTGTITCDSSTNQWIGTSDAICLPGNGSGVGDPDVVPPDLGDCDGGTPESSNDYSANVIAGPNLFTLAINGSNFDPQADYIAVIARVDCEDPSCSSAAGLLADELISCDQPGSTQTHLVCGDGISTGLPFQDDVNNLGKICFCDGSSRGGCRSVGDFNTEGPVIGGLSDNCVQNLTSIDIDFNSGVDTFGRSHGNLEFHGPSGFTVIFTDDDSNGPDGTDAAAGVEITNQNAGNIFAGHATNFVLGSRNQVQPDGTNPHTSGIVARFNHGARVVSFDDTDDDSTLKALYAYDEFGTLIGQSAFASQVPVFVSSDTHCNGNLIYSVEFDTLAGRAGGASDGTVFTIDNFHAEGVDACTAVTFQPSPAPTAPTAAPTTVAPTRGPGTRTCYATGDPHYKTFDDMYYDHFGQCDYMLTADCRQNGTQFQVQVRNDNPGSAVVTNVVSVAVQMPNGDVIELTSGGHSIVPAGGNTSSAFALPASGGDGTMYPWVAGLSGTRKSVRVPALGVEVLWDGTGGVPRNSVQVLLEPTSVLLGETCGLCGDADGNVTNDSDMVPEHDYWNANGNSSRRSRRQTGADRVTGSITCGSSVTVTVAGDNDFHPFLLDLSGRLGNTVVNLQTCNSPVSDPDLCLGSEYIDDDQISTSNAGGGCAARFTAGDRLGLGEDVTYLLAPGIYPVQIGTFSGTGDVTLDLTCTDGSGSTATPLRDNSARCFGARSVLTQSPSPPPTVLSVSAPTPSPTVDIFGRLFFQPDPLDGDVCVTGPPVVCVCADPAALDFCAYLRPGGEYSHCPGYSTAVYDSCVCDYCFDPEESLNIIRVFDDVCRPLVGSLATLPPTPSPTVSPTAPTIAPSTSLPTSLPTTTAPTPEPTQTPTTTEPSSNPTVSTTATSTQTTTPYHGLVECRLYHGWWYLVVADDQNCAMQIQLLDEVAQICNSVSGVSDGVQPLVCAPSGLSYYFLQATDTNSPAVCNQTVDPLNHAMAQFSRFFAGGERNVWCETDNVINHDTSDRDGCQGTADVLNAMIGSYGSGEFELCEVSTVTTSQTTTQTTTETSRPPTAVPSSSPTADPCLVHRCSGDCEGFVVAGAADRRFFCGWDSSSSLCVTGAISDPAEITALLETSPGDCNHLTLAPTTTPTPAPTAAPAAAPTVFPTYLPTLGPTLMPTTRPTPLPTFEPSMIPSNGPTPSPTPAPTSSPTVPPIPSPTGQPTSAPTGLPTVAPTTFPTRTPTSRPTISPTPGPTAVPTIDVCGQHQCSMDCEGPGTGGIGCGWDSATGRCRTGFVTVPEEADAMMEVVPGACGGHTEAPSMSPTSAPTSLPTEDPCGQFHCSRDCEGIAGFACGWDDGIDLAPGYCRTGFVTTSAESEALLETVPGACSRYTEAPTSLPTSQPTVSPTSLMNMLDAVVHQQVLAADETGAYCFFPDEEQGLPLGGALPMLPLQFSIRLEMELQAESSGTLFAKVSGDRQIFALHVMNSACGHLCTRGGLRIDYMAQRNSGQQSLTIRNLHLNDGNYHVLEISVNVDTLIIRVDEGNNAVQSDYEFQLRGPIDDCDATDGSCRAFVAMAVDGPPIDGCIMAAELTYCNECWPALATHQPTPAPVTQRPTPTPTDPPSTPAPSTQTPTALACPRNCGVPELGGGTCRATGRCTSCNSNRLRVNGRCVVSLSCISRVIQTGSMTGQGCGCIDRSCHSCTRTVTGDVCRRCRDGLFLLDDACVATCPATLASSGISQFGRRCLEPFTCRGGQVQNMDVNYGCKCAAEGNLPGANCHECEHHAGGYGEVCTRCNAGKYLYDSECRDSCTGLDGLISYNPGSYGRECRAPFSCIDRDDGSGGACKCPRSVGKNDCHACTMQLEGDFCLVCDNGKYLHQGACIDGCPAQRGFCGSGTETTGRQCVPCE